MALMKLSRLNCGDQSFYLYLSSEPDNGRIDLTLSNAVKSWRGNVSEDDFLSWSKKTKLKLSDYKTQTLKALSGEGLNGSEFVYEVTEEEDGSANLIWKRVLGGGDIKAQLGCVKLRPDLNLANSVRRILDSSIELTQKIQGQIQSLTEERDRLASEREMALQRLEKCVSIKEDTEKDLYSKFVVVLNSKKSKIRELKEQLEKVQSTTAISSSAPHSSAKCKGAATVRQSRAIHSVSSESEDGDHAVTCNSKPDNSDVEYNTDDELQSGSSAASKVISRGNRSKRGKTDDQVREDDDLMLDDGADDDNDVAVVPKRSRKAKQETVRKPASKPIIPHTEGSVAGQPSTSQRSSIRKSSSKGSSNNLDVSNLIDDMD